MSVYRLGDLIAECSATKGRLRVAKNRKSEIYQEVWAAINDWIFETMVTGKGAAMSFLGRLTWVTSQKYTGKAGEGKYVEKKKPIFLPSEYLIKSFQLQMKYRNGKDLKLAKDSPFNATRVAISYSTILTKDAVFSGVRDMFERLGLVLGTGKEVSIDFSVGQLIGQNRKVEFVFEREILQTRPNAPATLTKINMEPVGKDGVELPVEEVADANANVPKLQLQKEENDDDDDQGESTLDDGENGDVENADLDTTTDDYQPEVESMLENENLSMEDEFDLTEKLIGADLSPSMRAAYKRHLAQMKSKIKLEEKYLNMFQNNIAQYDRKQYKAYERMRQMNADVRKTLDWQHRQEIERRQLDLVDRKAKTITTLPVLEKSTANNGTDPIMGLGEVTTEKQVAERRRMQRILSEKIRARAEEARLREERKKQEERKFLQHMKQLGNAKDKENETRRRQEKAMLTAAWEREKHLKLLMKQHMPTRPAEFAGGTDPPPTGRSQFAGFSVGFDSR